MKCSSWPLPFLVDGEKIWEGQSVGGGRVVFGENALFRGQLCTISAIKSWMDGGVRSMKGEWLALPLERFAGHNLGLLLLASKLELAAKLENRLVQCMLKQARVLI